MTMKWHIRYCGNDMWDIIDPDGRPRAWAFGSAACAMALACRAIRNVARDAQFIQGATP